MHWLYSLGIWLYGVILRLIAPFHPKAKLWVDGRYRILSRIKQTIEPAQEYIWFHFASLGEFEQGRSVMEVIREKYSNEKIIVTFFSPSGYEIRKNTTLADYVFYLPEDTAKNAREFLTIVRPKFIVFTKYEYWYYYFREASKRHIPLFMISAIFRQDQLFFKPYGGFYRNILQYVSFFFTQNINSVYLLKSIGVTQAGLAGDTRFDRVVELPKQQKVVAEVDRFVGDKKVLVVGSSWLPDEQLICELLEKYTTWKCVLAPHEIHEEHLGKIIQLFPKSIRFSKFATYDAEQVSSAQVLIVDNIGLLSSLYGYGDIAYIGGGFGAGIHNTLEAATYGIPVLFGPRYEKFQEAVDLIELGSAFPIENVNELFSVFQAMQDEEKMIQAGRSAKDYVQQRSGATQIVVKYLETMGLISS